MYDDKPSSELVKELYQIRGEIPAVREAFRQLTKITQGASDVRDQSFRQVDLLDTLADLLPKGKFRIWLRYKYRPQKKFAIRALNIRKKQAESLHDYLEKYGPTDISRLEKKHIKEARTLYSDAVSGLYHVLDTAEIMYVLIDRHGAYSGYLSDRAYDMIKIILSAIVGALSALITKNFIG